MYYSAIGLLAIILLFIVNWGILRDPRIFDKPAWNVYKRFLFAVLIYYVTDVFWGLLESQKLSVALFVDTTIYFVAMAVGISFWAEYTVAYLDEKSTYGRLLIYSGRAIAILTAGFAIVNIFVPLLFSIDKNCVYSALPVRYVILALQILFLVIISVHALTTMFRLGLKGSKGVRYRILASFGIIMAICLFAQLLFPYLPLYSIAYMLGTCLLHAFLVNDEREDYRRELEEVEKVAELKDRFLSLLNNMPGMAFTKDAKTGRYLACNQAYAEYAHKDSPEGVTGLTDAQIFDPTTARHFTEDDKIALSLSKPYIFYEDVSDAAGNPRKLQTTKVKYMDTKGRLCVLGMCQDITDLVNIQHEQALTKEAYESAVSTGLMYNHIAQTLAREYTELFYINKDTEEFTEYRKDKESGTLSELRRGWHFFSDCKSELSECVHPEDREAFLQTLNRKKLMKALSQKETVVMTYRRMVNSQPVYFNMKISRMENDDHYIIIVFMDVDAEMREAMAKNAALADALSSAEEANISKTTFLNSMSHEIRTPINAIIGLDTLALKNDNLDPDTKKSLEEIGDGARHLLTIVNDVLNMSRLESGMVVLHKDAFSVKRMVEQINAQVISQCNDKGLIYECRMQSQIDDSYIGDDMKLKEVLLNLLSNSVKFTRKNGRVILTVEKADEYEDRDVISFRVRDTGIGMDEEFIPKVFDVFSQENSSDNSKYGSSGLGLAIAKSIVEMMNGSISVKSEKGVGSEFTVTVPLQKGGKIAPYSQRDINPESLHVLIVDDSPIEVEHAKMVLEEAGIRSDGCTSGQDALSKIELMHAKKEPYNIVLMDWSMPGMNGKETSAEILKRYKKETTVVVMTACNWDDISEEAHSVGVDNYIGKPLNAADIIENIEHIARRSSIAIFKEKKKARLEGRRILLAEDVEINAEIIEDMLEMENIKVDHAENGKAAVELFEESTAGIYSAILMDVRMPKMDGLEATKVIRSMDREDAKRIPIIALTANAFDEDVQRSVQAGMNAHINKPVETEHLLRILGELIYESEEKISGV